MKIAIIVGSLLSVFLLLMMPNVQTVEYDQVNSNIEKKINMVAERISQRLEQVNEKQMNILSKWIDIEGLKVFLDEITNNGNGICLSCIGRIRDCLPKLNLFLLNLFLAILFMFTPLGERYWSGAKYQVSTAVTIFNCLWAKIIYNIIYPSLDKITL